ncbi:MAG: tetratricopeptide repeat protein [Verrucomicrobiota bacterium]
MSAPIPSDDAVVERDEIDALLFWHTHKKNILLGALAIVVIGGGSLAWYVHSTLTAKDAIAALANAKDIPQLETVIKTYGGTMPAADAILLLAAENQKAGHLAESTAAFQSFLKSFPDHPLAGGALLGIGQNQDASGKPDEAMATYQQVVEQYPKSYAAPFAGYVQAEILLRTFQREKAKVVLDSLVSQFPDSTIARLASAQLARIRTTQPPR